MSVNQYNTVVEALEDLARRGFAANFEYADGALVAIDSGRRFQAEQLTTVSGLTFQHQRMLECET